MKNPGTRQMRTRSPSDSADITKPGVCRAEPVYRRPVQQAGVDRIKAGDIDAIVARLARLLGRQLARDVHAAAHDKKVGG
jgi:hypothetical protein